MTSTGPTPMKLLFSCQPQLSIWNSLGLVSSEKYSLRLSDSSE
jgi:hypothetical protein